MPVTLCTVQEVEIGTRYTRSGYSEWTVLEATVLTKDSTSILQRLEEQEPSVASLAQRWVSPLS